MKIHRFQLPNGLTVLLEPDRRIHSVAMGFGADTGGQDEMKIVIFVTLRA